MKHLALLVITICVLAVIASAIDLRCGMTVDRDLVVIACRAGRITAFMGGAHDEQ